MTTTQIYNAPDWVGVHVPHWNMWLKRFIGQPNVRALEIGSFEGRSACWFVQNVLTHETSSLTCVDPWDYSLDKSLGGGSGLGNRQDFSQIENAFMRNTEPFRTSGRIRVEKGVSRKVLPRLVNEAFDFIYVDGSHIASSVIEDSVLSWLMLKNTGIMIWDDYLWDHDVRKTKRHLARPKMAVDAFLAIYEDQYRLLHKEGQVVIEKISPAENRACASS